MAIWKGGEVKTDRWGLYELLKSSRDIDAAIKKIETMDIMELREGVIEYLISRGHNDWEREIATCKESRS
ncbi:hypothetical protein OXPF_34480 [Oxobacter pfennigii]|uniref:Uncharacterized protein n=1 Tax=Oxobacter pfennigii TaxID=36849 RepID=A0A0N8NSU6_9CLOT|nr:hypothetical protein [Oxobacter pfennigii]KPU43016.1 hypothetical protein OXPF_34480 [Oxobacter pfennigii]